MSAISTNFNHIRPPYIGPPPYGTFLSHRVLTGHSSTKARTKNICLSVSRSPLSRAKAPILQYRLPWEPYRFEVRYHLLLAVKQFNPCWLSNESTHAVGCRRVQLSLGVEPTAVIVCIQTSVNHRLRNSLSTFSGSRPAAMFASYVSWQNRFDSARMQNRAIDCSREKNEKTFLTKRLRQFFTKIRNRLLPLTKTWGRGRGPSSSTAKE